ncbi:sulfotransferase 1E1-like isoform X1 [Scylla paramamosain]|uniref:sulfotransferase 1E1-like isoform X1 n=1 Tax=Scylla paramamosain TaxID=85552 RepID=UPI0030829F35
MKRAPRAACTAATQDQCSLSVESNCLYREAGSRVVKILKALQTLKGTISLIEMSKQLLSGHTYEELKEEELKALDLDHFDHGVVRIQPEGWLYPGTAPIYLDKLYNMEFRSDDVIVKTFPKCGTTWMQEIVWTMLHNPNLDNPKADEFLWIRSEDISLDMMFDVETFKGQPPNYYLKKFNETCPGKKWEEGLSLQLAEVAKSPRVIKSHFPLSLYPDDILDRIKVVYVTRNPKDMIVSYSYFFEALKVFPVVSSMEETQKKLMTGQILYGPYWSHVKQAWQKRHHPNLHFVFYEDMKADIMSELRKLNEFLGTQLSEEKLEAIAQYTSFSSMKARGEPLQDDVFHKENKSDVKFFRKGKTGDWKNHFTPELQKKMDHWIKENIADTDLNLKWALAE